MPKIKNILILFCFFLLSNSWAQVFSRDLLLSPKYKKKFGGKLSQRCNVALTNFYLRGGLLESDYLKNSLVKLGEYGKDNYNLEYTRNNITKLPKGHFTFFHYTRNEQPFLEMFEYENRDRDSIHSKLLDNDSEDSYSGITRFLKFKVLDSFRPYHLRGSKGVFYVSDCPECSTSFGHVQLSFTLSPETNVLITTDNANWGDVEKEISLKYDILDDCTFREIDLFVFEDSGVDLLRYTNRWYQFLNFNRVINSDIGIVRYPGTADGVTKLLQHSRESYSLNDHEPSYVSHIPKQEPFKINKIISAKWIYKKKKFLTRFKYKTIEKDMLNKVSATCRDENFCEIVFNEDLFDSKVKLKEGKSKFLTGSTVEIKFECDNGDKSFTKSVQSQSLVNPYGEKLFLSCL